jgi:hypothetical protein
MRIKIIGDNNCARATRHLLRLAGFAVTEFLPDEAVTHGPHAGYAITIDLAPAPQTPDSRLRPDSPTQHQQTSASEEAPRSHRGASSPAFVRQSEGRASAGLPAAAVHFDSVDSALEAAVLRHVAQLAAAPVIVDRPGGVVHSDRELRIVAPTTGDAKADEAAAVAIEFGVLRGLLDLTSPAYVRQKAWRISAGKPAEVPQSESQTNSGSAGKKRWWPFGIVLLAALWSAGVSPAIWRITGRERIAGVTPALRSRSAQATVDAAEWAAQDAANTSRLKRQSSFVDDGRFCSGRPPRRTGTLDTRACSFDAADERYTASRSIFLQGLTPAVIAHAAVDWVMESRRLKPAPLGIARLEGASLAWVAEPHRLKPVLLEPAQGQFATGQGFKITDGTNFLVVDPCKGQVKLYASISQTANTQLVAGTASKKIYVCSVHVVAAAAANVAVVEGTGSVCGTSTAGVSGFGGATAATGWNFAANGGIALGNGDSSLGAEGTSGDNLCLFNSGSGQVSGGISYVVQ